MSPHTFSGCSTVVHMAGVVAHTRAISAVDQMWRVNVGGTKRVIRAAAQVGYEVVAVVGCVW